ncbi:MAG: nucleotidyl transferase AbiEii/AbiGii toxin family protein, partial [Alphaproteobacteria bacterium]
MSAPPRLFDRALHRRRLDRAAAKHHAADFLQARAAGDIVERLESIQRRFPLAVDLGARRGAFSAALLQSPAREKIGLVIETDLSTRMLAGRPGLRLQADEERLPFAPESLDLVVSALALHWTNDLPGTMIQIRRALKPDGLFLGAILGGETLTELRQSLMAAEAELSDGAGLRVAPLADAFDAAGLLQRAGFALPVADVDRVVVRYSHPLKLIGDLRAMGETAALAGRARPLSRAVIARACEIYAERFSGPDGKVAATFELYDGRPSTRYRDLVDLFLLLRHGEFDLVKLRTAIHTEFDRRHLRLPTEFAVPDPSAWQRGWGKIAKGDAPFLAEVPFAEALVAICEFLHPVLASEAEGLWDVE